MNADVLPAASPGAANEVPGQSGPLTVVRGSAPKRPEPFDPTKLLSATEKAMAAIPPESKSVTGCVLAELAKPKATSLNAVRSKHIWPEEIFRDGKLERSSVKTMEQVMMHGPVLVSDASLSKLAQAEQAMLATAGEGERFSSRAAHERYMKQFANPLAGELTEEIALRSRDAVSADFRAKQSAIVARLVALTNDHVQLCKLILAEARKQVAEWLETREASDREECDAFGIPYRASAAYCAVVHLAMTLTDARLPRPGEWALPSRVLAGIVTINPETN